MKSTRPKILLIGAGSFGAKHLKALLNMEKQGLCEVTGVVVKSDESRQRVSAGLQAAGLSRIPVYIGLEDSILAEADAVDIVTPVETHSELIRRCLPSAHVFVEKPISDSDAEAASLESYAKKSMNLLMVGHIYRYHPVMIALKKKIAGEKEAPRLIEASLINPESTDTGRDPELEMLHPYDMIDFLFGAQVLGKRIEKDGRLRSMTLNYEKGISVSMKLGWSGPDRIRVFDLYYADKKISCDFGGHKILVFSDGKPVETIDCGDSMPLDLELSAFAAEVANRMDGRMASDDLPGASVGRRIVTAALMVTEKTSR